MLCNNPTIPETYLLHTDNNNQYGDAMTQFLPQAGFKWMQQKPTAEDIRAWSDDEQYGAILEVDLEYLEELHDAHKDLPL